MRRGLRILALLCCVSLIAAACSRPKTQAVKAPTKNEGLSALDAPQPGTESASAAEAKGVGPETAQSAAKKVTGKTAATQQSAVNPFLDTEQAKKVGALIRPQSSAYPNNNPNTWTGVTKDTLKLVFSIDQTNCGVNVINAVTAAQTQTGAEGDRYYRPAPKDIETANKQRDEAIEVMVNYWNEHLMDMANLYPNIVPVLEKFNTPGHLFYGRKLQYVLTDGGSYQCPDRTTAGAVRIVNEIKPFGVFTDDIPGIEGSGYNMAAALNAKAPPETRPLHFGTIHISDRNYKKWAPYAWTQFISGTAELDKFASWLCTRVIDKPAANSSQYGTTPRKFGLAVANSQNYAELKEDFKASLGKYCGNKQVISPDAEFTYSYDVSRAGDEGTQMAVKYKLLGVTSVIFIGDPIMPLFHLLSFKGQSYMPELVWPGISYVDTTTVNRAYDQDMVNKASFGISAFGQPGGWGPVTDPFYVYHASHKTSPNTKKACDPSTTEGMNHDIPYCKAPGQIATWYYTFLAFIGGLIFAGPEATPAKVTAGLQNYPLTRYSASGPTDDPRAALVGAGPGQYYFITDAAEWRWRAKYYSPYDTDADRTIGFVEYPDCGRHYYTWAGDKLSIGWEKGGPNYDAWCGNEKYAPADSPEKDGYPRWK